MADPLYYEVISDGEPVATKTLLQIKDEKMDHGKENGENEQTNQETMQQSHNSSSQYAHDLEQNKKNIDQETNNRSAENRTLNIDELEGDKEVNRQTVETVVNCVEYDLTCCGEIMAAVPCREKGEQEMESDSIDKWQCNATSAELRHNENMTNQANGISQNFQNEYHNGRHVQELRKSLSTIVEKFISHIKFSKFREHLRPIYQHNPRELKKIHGQFVKQLESNISDEIEKMIEEENIVGLLNKLDELNSSSDQNGVVWRPSGDPQSDILAHVMPIKMKEQKQLKKMLSDLEVHNSLLKEALRFKQKRLIDTKCKIEKHFKDISKVSQVQIPIEEIRAFHENNP